MDLLPKEYYEMRAKNNQRFYERLLELALYERKNNNQEIGGKCKKLK